MKPSHLLLTSFVVALSLAWTVSGVAEAANFAVSVSVPAITEAYFTTFTLSLTNPSTGRPTAGWVVLQNLPASSSDTDYYVDYAAVAAGSPLPPYGQLGWSDLGPGQAGAPFFVNGSDTVQVLAYDNEAQGDNDGNDRGQRLAVEAALSNSPFTPDASMAVPVVPATLSANPASLVVGAPTAVTFSLKSATGAPLSGYSVQPEQGSSPSGTTDASGQVTLTLDPTRTGTVAFWAEDDADNGNNLAGIQFAGAYPVATLTVGAPPSPPPPTPPPTTAILARVDLPYDALVGQVLAYREQWRVYLTEPTALSPETSAQLAAAHVTRVVVLGGPAAVSPAVVSALQHLGIHVMRLWGWDRYGTAAAVAQYEGDPSGIAVVTGGLSYADLLSVAAVAGARQWPLFLADAQGIPGPEQAALTADRVKMAYVVGSAATVDRTALAQLARLGIRTVRIAGPTLGDPYGTEAALMRAFRPLLNWRTLYVASGTGFLDGLESSPEVANAHSMVVQVPVTGSLPTALATAMAALRGIATQVTVAGPAGDVPAPVLRAVEQILGL